MYSHFCGFRNRHFPSHISDRTMHGRFLIRTKCAVWVQGTYFEQIERSYAQVLVPARDPHSDYLITLFLRQRTILNKRTISGACLSLSHNGIKMSENEIITDSHSSINSRLLEKEFFRTYIITMVYKKSAKGNMVVLSLCISYPRCTQGINNFQTTQSTYKLFHRFPKDTIFKYTAYNTGQAISSSTHTATETERLYLDSLCQEIYQQYKWNENLRIRTVMRFGNKFSEVHIQPHKEQLEKNNRRFVIASKCVSRVLYQQNENKKNFIFAEKAIFTFCTH